MHNFVYSQRHDRIASDAKLFSLEFHSCPVNILRLIVPKSSPVYHIFVFPCILLVTKTVLSLEVMNM
jgi:hypothetical protein